MTARHTLFARVATSVRNPIPIAFDGTKIQNGFARVVGGIAISRSQAGLVCWLLSLCLSLFQPSGANGEAPSAKGGSVRISAEATRVNQAPKLDGTLNDLLWQSANPISDFRQREPHEGEAPSEETEVRILYTRHAVYFGIHCFDSEP